MINDEIFLAESLLWMHNQSEIINIAWENGGILLLFLIY